jgi:hypothetical protein
MGTFLLWFRGDTFNVVQQMKEFADERICRGKGCSQARLYLYLQEKMAGTKGAKADTA